MLTNDVILSTSDILDIYIAESQLFGCRLEVTGVGFCFDDDVFKVIALAPDNFISVAVGAAYAPVKIGVWI